jgi:hypothetical protein
MFTLLAIYISLLTCTPGKEMYARYGHTALRVVDTEQQMDVCFNYGMFDFNTEHFYYKFVRGETYYQLGAEDTYSFLMAYKMEGRQVYEQQLNLTDSQAVAVRDALIENYQPENRQYLYNFVFDNCATRPLAVIEKAVGDTIRSTYSGWKGKTFRQILQYYTGMHSWAEFGTNLLFGRRADREMTQREKTFLPEQLMLYLSYATFSDGTPVVAKEHIGAFRVQPVRWYETWYIGLALFVLLFGALCIYDRLRCRISYGVDIALAVVYVIVFIIVVFLTFFSIHPLVGFNWRLFLFPALHAALRWGSKRIIRW